MPSKPQKSLSSLSQDPSLEAEVERLHRLWIHTRWRGLGLLWLLVMPLAAWHLRDEIALWKQYFTWTAVRFGLIYHPLAAAGLIFCLSLTVSTLIWQSYTLLFGIPKSHRQRLSQQVSKIRQRGPSHPLWDWVCEGRLPQSGPFIRSAQRPPHDQPRPQRRKGAP
ncbi:MAG: hypothetical protein OHK0037_18060 [Elainellaceae cyanobacterium]